MGAADGVSNLATYGCQPAGVDSRRAALIRARHIEEWGQGNPGEPDDEERLDTGLTQGGVVGLASEDLGLLEVREFSTLRTIGFGYLVLVGVVIISALIFGIEDP